MVESLQKTTEKYEYIFYISSSCHLKTVLIRVYVSKFKSTAKYLTHGDPSVSKHNKNIEKGKNRKKQKEKNKNKNEIRKQKNDKTKEHHEEQMSHRTHRSLSKFPVAKPGRKGLRLKTSFKPDGEVAFKFS